MDISVTINKTHINEEGLLAQYMDNNDCPLNRAIKEQHPDVMVAHDIHVLGEGTLLLHRPGYTERIFPDGKWTWAIAKRLMKGEINNVVLNYKL